MVERPPQDPDSALVIWRRRALSLSVLALATVVLLSTLPLSVPLALAVDLVRQRRFATTRALFFVLGMALAESLGVAAAALIWLRRLVPGGDRESWLEANYRLQSAWVSGLWALARACFSLELHVEGAEVLEQGGGLMFLRHTGLGDTLLPILTAGQGYGLRSRYVMKRELLWDPCLDIVGNRVPNAFLRRGSNNRERELANLRWLIRDMGPREVLVLYPEGTRFTPGRRAKLLARLEEKGDLEALAEARSFEQVLPPRPGGPAAVLATRQDLDVIFVAHAGFEKLTRLDSALSGAIVGQRVEARLWRVPAAHIPREPAARRAWLVAQWHEMDHWVRTRELGSCSARHAA